MKYGMVACAALDIKKGMGSMRSHSQNAFDLGTPAGLVFLACYSLNYEVKLLLMFLYL